MLQASNWFVNTPALIAEIIASGITAPPAEKIVRDKPTIRWRTTGSSASGWLKISADGFVATWGDFIVSDSAIGSTCCRERMPQKVVRQQVQRLVAAANKEAEAESAAKTAIARALFSAAIEGQHAYLDAKGIDAGPARVRKGTLLVPGYNGAGELQCVQRIYMREGRFEKRFLGPAKGARAVIGELRAGAPYLLCEGFATGMSLHLATRLPVVVAFSAGNLLPVAQSLPDYPVVVCADNDASGTGLMKAEAVQATLSNAVIAMPVLVGDDFNDLAARDGLSAVADIVMPVATALSRSGAAALRLMSLGIDPVGLEDGNPKVFIRATRGMLVIRAKKDSVLRLGEATCLALGEKVTDDEITIDVDRVFSTLHAACARIGEVSTTNSRGAGLWRRADGTVMLHDGRHIVTDGDTVYLPGATYLRPVEGDVRTDMQRLHAELARKYSAHAATAIVGWLVQALAAGALDWRTHMWLKGEPGSGKSWLQSSVLGNILGEAGLVVDGASSVAGIRQLLRQSARPVIVEETEPNNCAGEGQGRRISELLQMARSASSSVTLALGGQDGASVKTFALRSAFCFGSITSYSDGAADDSRIVPVELARNDVHSALLADTAWLRSLGPRLLAALLSDFDNFAGAIAEAASESSRAATFRAGQTLGNIIGAARWALGDETLVLEQAQVAERFTGSDGEDVLSRIAAIRVTAGQGATTVGSMLAEGREDVPGEHGLALIAPRGKEAHLFVAGSSPSLAKVLGMRDRSWRDLLSRVTGAYSGTGRVNGRVERGILIPLSTVLAGDQDEPESVSVAEAEKVLAPIASAAKAVSVPAALAATARLASRPAEPYRRTVRRPSPLAIPGSENVMPVPVMQRPGRDVPF